MSVEIQGFDERDITLVSAVAGEAGRVAIAQGMTEQEAFVIGNRVAQYAVQLLTTVLREAGAGEFLEDQQGIFGAIDSTVESSINPS